MKNQGGSAIHMKAAAPWSITLFINVLLKLILNNDGSGLTPANVVICYSHIPSTFDFPFQRQELDL